MYIHIQLTLLGEGQKAGDDHRVVTLKSQYKVGQRVQV